MKKLHKAWQTLHNKVTQNLASFDMWIYFSFFQQLKTTSNTKTYRTFKKKLSIRTGNFLSILSHDKGVLH